MQIGLVAEAAMRSHNSIFDLNIKLITLRLLDRRNFKVYSSVLSQHCKVVKLGGWLAFNKKYNFGQVYQPQPSGLILFPAVQNIKEKYGKINLQKLTAQH